eukprot:TRINITY_DN6620_c0_g1_i1.p2 TRINITY_DN6620_c0_g1~~TRINITY_DN6620_c0_g1_i1.p2  ORF type:complete len:122 (-),score=28.19 TRINITY_DN6620_c0_g1_i1:115-480(-)
MSKTEVKDQGMIALSQALPRMSMDLKTFWLRLTNTGVSDVGVVALVDALLGVSHLSKLYLDLEECVAVTNASCDKFAELLSMSSSLNEISLHLEGTLITRDKAERVRRIKSTQLSSVEIRA